MPFLHDLALTPVGNQSPCKGCLRRALSCHVSCPEYEIFRARCDLAADERQRKREVDECIGDAMKRIPGKRKL